MNEPQRKRRRKKKRRKKKKQQVDYLGGILGFVRDFYSEYELLIKPLGAAAIVGIALFFGFAILQNGSIGGRSYKEFANRTTPAWIEMEREGKARKAEVLWQDQRWMPLGQVLGLDWEAVPDLLEALTDDRTKRLAEETLGKYDSTQGSPRTNDIVEGLQHEQSVVRLWAAKLSSRVNQTGHERVRPLLEEFAEQREDEQLSTAAQASLSSLNSSG